MALTALPTAREAIDALRERDGGPPDLGLVLDPDRHAELLGFTSEVERMRYKPGVSAVAAVRDGQGRCHWIHSNTATEKFEKGEQRAASAGERVSWVAPHTRTGPAFADRMLAPIVARIRRDDPAALDGVRVVRYNPHRRLVLRRAGSDGAVSAIKLSANPEQLGDEVARRLAAGGAPVLAPARVRSGVTATPWWGSDLSMNGPTALERSAGAALAQVHRMPLTELPPLASIDATLAAFEAAGAVSLLLPCLAARAQALAERLAVALPAGRDEVVVHGDWSLDQVLSDGHEVRFIDFDRAALAPVERDLGSALASGASSATLDGYLDAGGRFEARALEAWTSLSVLQRAVEPFRTGQSEWPTVLERELRRAEQALA